MFKFLGKLVLRHPFITITTAALIFRKIQKVKQEMSHLGTRSLMLKKFAKKNGFDFAEYDFSLYEPEFAKLPFFTAKHGSIFTNVLKKPKLTISDFVCIRKTGGNIRSQTIAVIQNEKAKDISFTVRPGGFFVKLIPGHKDGEIFENKEFAKNFVVTRDKIEDSKLTEILDSKVQHFFADNKNWTVMVSGGNIVILRENCLVDARKMGSFLSSVIYIATIMGFYP